LPLVQQLVTLFETIHHELEIESVWFIKKSRRGDGFQRWHQDLVRNGTTVATIVVNIDSVDKEDEEFAVENIRKERPIEQPNNQTTERPNDNRTTYRQNDRTTERTIK
jgi:hypothetical protein